MGFRPKKDIAGFLEEHGVAHGITPLDFALELLAALEDWLKEEEDVVIHQTHTLKTWPVYFASTQKRVKNFELRKNDRNFRVGDTVILHEWDPASEIFTGEIAQRSIVYILDGAIIPGLESGYCILGLTPCGETKI